MTSQKSKLSGANGKPEFRVFYNASGVAQLTKFESTGGGAGFKEADIAVGGEPVLEALEGKMYVISGR